MPCLGRCKVPCLSCCDNQGESVRPIPATPAVRRRSPSERAASEQIAQPRPAPEAAAGPLTGRTPHVPVASTAVPPTGDRPGSRATVATPPTGGQRPTSRPAAATPSTGGVRHFPAAAARSSRGISQTTGSPYAERVVAAASSRDDSSTSGSPRAGGAAAAASLIVGSSHAGGSPLAGESPRAGGSPLAGGSPRVRGAVVTPSKGPPAAPSAGTATAGPSKALSRVSQTAVKVSQKQSGGQRALARPSTSRAGSAPRLIQLGITTEFFLAAKNKDHSGTTVKEFVELLAANHDQQAGSMYQMRPTIRPELVDVLDDLILEEGGRQSSSPSIGPVRKRERTDYRKWCLVDSEIVSFGRPSPWGLELISPILKTSRDFPWRKGVEATWKYLGQHYNITGSDACGTHIHISMEPELTIREIKRIAQATIHFEAAIEALMPANRRGNQYAKSNWLDNPALGHHNLSRPESIAEVEKVRSFEALLDCMGEMFNRNYCWNFESLRDQYKSTIEFRKPPVSTTAEQALSWAELAMSFVQASIKCESPKKLQEVPSTVGGLRWFLEQSYVEGVNEQKRLDRIFGDKDLIAVEPIPRPEDFFVGRSEVQKWKGRLEGKAEEDRKEILRLANNVKAPYWK